MMPSITCTSRHNGPVHAGEADCADWQIPSRGSVRGEWTENCVGEEKDEMK